MFHPFQPQMVIGGTFTGQIVLWDTRIGGHQPCHKTPLSVGHTHPVYSMSVIGSANAHSILSISTDGLACTWQPDRLGQPSSVLELSFPTHMRTDEVAVTALAFPSNSSDNINKNVYAESDLFFVGTEEGKIYQGSRMDRAGSKAGLFPHDTYKGHSAPVTSISFHPSSSSSGGGNYTVNSKGRNNFTVTDSEPALTDSTTTTNTNNNNDNFDNFSIYSGPSKLFLSCAMDWTVRIWKAKSMNKPSVVPTVIEPLLTLEGSADSVISDAKWHPTRPNLLGAVNGAGIFDLWDLNLDHQVRQGRIGGDVERRM